MAKIKILPDNALNIIRQKAYQAELMQPENKYVVERADG